MIIGTILFFWLILGTLDTLIGNRILPGRVQVVKMNNDYCRISKIHRIMGIPVKYWLRYCDTERSIFDFCASYSNAEAIYINDAIHYAKIYSNKLVPNITKDPNLILWDSRTSTKPKKKVDDNKDNILLLVPRLIEAVEKDDKVLELKILEKIKALNN